MLQDDEYFYISEDADVEDVLQSRDSVIKILATEGISGNEELVKKLVAWKFHS